MLPRLCLILTVLGFVGCLEAPSPVLPVDPIPAGAVLPPGMPNDRWFFENVVQSEVPVLVDFTATWCRPCQEMKPALHEIEKAYGNRLKVIEVDIDDHPGIADHFRVSSVPRLMVIKNGAIEAEAPGKRTYYEIINVLKSSVGRP